MKSVLLRRTSSISSSTTLLLLLSLLTTQPQECEGNRRENSYFSANKIQKLIRARCNQQTYSNNALPKTNDDSSNKATGGAASSGIWAYEGTLIDPFTGARIADCEGLEICSSVGESYNNRNCSHSDSSEHDEVRGLLDNEDDDVDVLGKYLTVGEILNASASKNSWDFASTLLSRKLFCYRDPNDPRKLLEAIRIRPGAGKERRIAKREAVALYDTATTFVSRNGGSEMVVCTEWPDGRFILGEVQVPPDHAAAMLATNANKWSDAFDFSIYARRRATERKKDVLPPLKTTTERSSSAIASASPPRSKLVQFGKDDRSIEQTRYGARESYSYTFSTTAGARIGIRSVLQFGTNLRRLLYQQYSKRFQNNSGDVNNNALLETAEDTTTLYTDATVRYSRYGECPPWYGPGKMCTLELVGKRIDSFRDAPPLAARIASEVPGFTSSFTAAANADDKAQRLKWFREDNVQFLPDDENYADAYQKIVHRIQAEGLKLWQRLQRATKLSSA